MLIRSKLLLLAGIPLPVLLVLGGIAVSSAHDHWQQADRLATGLRLLRAVRDATQAAGAQRDAEAAQVSSQSRGLESLLLGEAPDRAPVPRQAAALSPDAIAAVDVGALNEPVRAAAQSLVTQAGALRARGAPSSDASLTQVNDGYGAFMRLSSALPELLAGMADSAERARELRTLAVVDRYVDALARERIYVRHAVVTNTLSPRLVREFTANEGIKDLERNLLEEVFGSGALRDQLMSARARARAAGRDRALEQVHGFADRQDKLAVLYGALGYGGLTYHFHDFLLHGGDDARRKFEAQAAAATGVIEQLLAAKGLSESEQADLRTVARTIEAYRAGLSRMARLRAQGLPPARIDQMINIDDAPALAALERLATFRPAITAAQWESVSGALLADVRRVAAGLEEGIAGAVAHERDLRRRQMLALASGAILTLLLLAAFAALLYRRIADGIRALVQEFDRVARTGDVQTRAVVEGEDELALLNQAVAAIGRRLQAMADAAESMAQGDLVGGLAPLGPQDRLAHAMAALAESDRSVVAQAQAISAGDYATRVEPRSPRDTLAFALAEMGQALRKFRDETREAQWLSAGQLKALAAMRGAETPQAVGERALAALAELTAAPVGVLYLSESEGLRAIAQRAASVDVAAQVILD